MASGILGLGSSGSTSLNSDLITKLKTAESKAVLDPITAQKTATQAELDAKTAVQTKVTELLDIVKNFDLYTSGTNTFDSVSATTSGTSVTFDASDTSKLTPGTINVSISQLAQKDIYQSDTISDPTASMPSGSITIKYGKDASGNDLSATFSTTNTDGTAKTYQDLITEMGNYPQFSSSLEQVGDSSYRIVIKSANSGTTNALTITQSGIDLGLEKSANHVLTAQNMQGTIDGISYDISSNKVTMSTGLSVTANSTGNSSINISRDTSGIASGIENISTKYNELVDLVNSYIIGANDKAPVISDSSTLKGMISGIKDILFGTYGLSNDENIFKYGLSYDEYGHTSVDSTKLSEAVTNNFSNLKDLFVGPAEKEGIGTKLKTYLDALDGTNGLLTGYEKKLNDKITKLGSEYDTTSANLDTKYTQMSDQFAQYTVLITQMQNSFSSLKLMMQSNNNSSN